MGVPAFFRWLSEKYPKIISPCYEEMPQEVDGEEIPIDITGPNRNGDEFDNLYLDMNGIVHPCSHPEDRPAPKNEEEMMLAIFEYTDRIVRIVRPRKILMMAVDGVAPRAKMNQQRSRRFRSALEAKKKEEEKADFDKNFLKKSQNNGEADSDEPVEEAKAFDSNVITPGTPFMDVLAQSLRYWVAYKLNTDPGWANLKIIISDATVPGEGEHKIMEFIRSQRQTPTHDPNTRHVIYGLDADLIMLGLATHEPHFRVLREDVFFQSGKPNACRRCGQVGHKAAECRGLAKEKDGEFDEKQKIPPKPYIWLHVNVLREYLAAELSVPELPFKWNVERAIDDWVFLCFFVGNDFLPHLPSLDIKEEGIDALTAIWRDNLALMGGYMTEDGHVNLERAQYILSGLAKQENAIFKRRKQIDDKREAGRKRRKQEEDRRKSREAPGGNSFDTSEMNAPIGNKRQKKTGHEEPLGPLFDPAQLNSREVRQLTHDQFVNRRATFQAVEANKSAAAVLKEQLRKKSSASELADSAGPSEDAEAATAESPATALGKRKAELIEGDDSSNAQVGTPGRSTPVATDTSINNPDEPRPDDIRLWEDGYGDRYYEKKFGVNSSDIKFRNSVANAYVEGLCWVLLYYMQGCPSWTWYYPHHYAPFAADFVDIGKLDIKFNKGQPFRPFEQLMGVLPARSNHAIPEPFHPLMEDPDSEIIDFYPEEFEIDLNGKKFDWQGVALLPFIDEKRLLAAMATKYPLLTEADHARNGVGQEVLLFSGKHPLYESMITQFYSKKKGDPKAALVVAKSHGLAGDVLKHETFMPSGPLTSPLTSGEMPDLDEDLSMSVYYEMPISKKIHKSMLLKGIKMPNIVLDQEDIAKTRGRARNSGRSFGGAPLRENGYGQGQRNGGRINYAAGPDYRQSNNNYNGGPPRLPAGLPYPPPPPGFPPPGFSLPPPPAGVRLGEQSLPFPPPPMAYQGGPPPNWNAGGGNYGGYNQQGGGGGGGGYGGGHNNQYGGGGGGYGGPYDDRNGYRPPPRDNYGGNRRQGDNRGYGGGGGYGGRR